MDTKGTIRRPIGILKQGWSQRLKHKAVEGVSSGLKIEDAFWPAHADAAAVL
jgi:hypothetical protein